MDEKLTSKWSPMSLLLSRYLSFPAKLTKLPGHLDLSFVQHCYRYLACLSHHKYILWNIFHLLKTCNMKIYLISWPVFCANSFLSLPVSRFIYAFSHVYNKKCSIIDSYIWSHGKHLVFDQDVFD